MLEKWLIKIDETSYVQRFVAWLLSKKASSPARLASQGATHAVCLSVSSSLIPAKDLFEAVTPKEFGARRDYKVVRTCVSRQQALAVLLEPRTSAEFVLVMPVHADFPRRLFLSSRKLRLTCEAQRAHLVTVRRPDGTLLAAGTLELVPQAAFSWEHQCDKA